MTLQPPPPSRYPGADAYERNLQRIRLRQDTEENWLKNDPLLASGEMGYTIGGQDAGSVLKVGDGTRRWSELPYLMAQGNSGAPGPAGADGHSIAVYGPSVNPPAPAVTQLFKGDIWLSDGLYAKNPSFDASLITPGAKGDKGDAATIDKVSAVQLPTGTQPTINNVGDTHHAQFVFGIPEGGLGPQGIQGIQGPPGPKGPAGDTFKVSGAVADAARLPVAPANLSVYITQDNSHLHIYDTASAAAGPNGYVDLGAIAGPQGASTFFSAPVAKAADLPATGAAGQAIISLDDGHMHSWDVTSGTWTDAGQIRGPSGAGISDGTADGQVPIWSVTFHSWTPTLLTFNTITDVDVSQQEDGSALEDADILHYDLASQTWKAVGIRDYLQDEVELANLGDCTISGGSTPADGQVLTWDNANSVWTNASLPPSVTSLSALTDVDVATAPPVAGQALVWSATVSKWVPGDAAGASPIVFLAQGAINTGAALDGSDSLYGMPAGTTPSPLDFPPIPGDSFIDLSTGLVTTFTGPTATKRTAGAVTGHSAGYDAIRETLGELDDVSSTTPTDNQILRYSAAARQWQPVDPGFATTSYVDMRVESLAIGLAHDVAVASIRNDPPNAQQSADMYFIVGLNPTGDWAGHANDIAHYTISSGGVYDWHFESPQDQETHLVEDQAATYTWNGTAWVKVAAAQTGANVNASSLYQVGDIKQSILTETQFRTMLGTAEADKWALADGRNVAGSAYHTLTGNANVPDLRGAFLRMAGQNATNASWVGGTLGAYQEDTTARPKAALTGTTNSTGSHTHTSSKQKSAAGSGNAASENIVAGDGYNANWGTITNASGSHSHSVTINGGGDTETRPKNYSVNYYIKVRA